MFKFMLQLCFVAFSPEAPNIEKKMAETLTGNAGRPNKAPGVWSLQG